MHIYDTTCIFCIEKESICHLFFGCVVAKRAWNIASNTLEMDTGTDYESIARLWLCNKKYGIVIVTSAMWSLETKKFYDLPGCCLDRHEIAMADGRADAEKY
jgi:hypothetical protein